MTFLHKSVGEEDTSFGSDLRDLRELQQCHIDEAAHQTRIDVSILRALEEERLEDLDDPIFTMHHLRAYVRYLGGYETYFLSRYRAKLASIKKERTIRDLLPRVRRIRPEELLVGPRLFAIIGLLLGAVALGMYVMGQALHVNTPPTLEVFSPEDGMRLEHPLVRVTGRTIPEAYVDVNGVDAPVDSEGNFILEINVPRGTTILTIIATRRRGSETRVERRVIFERKNLQSDQQE